MEKLFALTYLWAFGFIKYGDEAQCRQLYEDAFEYYKSSKPN